MDLVHCVYCSASTELDPGRTELQTLLDECRRNNARADITPKALANRSMFSDCGFTSPRSRRPIVDCVTPDLFESAVCVLMFLLASIKPRIA
jgi:hypothetical protein